MLPARITELKKAAARAGALTALIRAKAWIPDLEADDIIKGYPGVKEDSSNFDELNHHGCITLADWLCLHPFSEFINCY